MTATAKLKGDDDDDSYSNLKKINIPIPILPNENLSRFLNYRHLVRRTYNFYRKINHVN